MLLPSLLSVSMAKERIRKFVMIGTKTKLRLKCDDAIVLFINSNKSFIAKFTPLMEFLFSSL